MFIKRREQQLVIEDTPIVLKGVGLNGWFLPEGYMWKLPKSCDRPRRIEALIEGMCGKDYAQKFWKRYMECYITREDIESIAEHGLNSVRLPLNARHMYALKEGRMEWNEELFGRIDQLLDWCKDSGIYVVIDMHAAPGGQTGENIDDSLKNQPELFMHPEYEEQVIALWTEIARRYAEESIVAGYDLLNEPLPEWFSEYNEKVLPLYKRITEAIRRVDSNHLIILEGVHWATNWVIFEPLKAGLFDENIMLQFHKYWSNPNQEALEEYLEYRHLLNVPIYMGEGGENTLDWYTGFFPHLESLDISWNFWSYKKMDADNSPKGYYAPKRWDALLSAVDPFFWEEEIVSFEEAEAQSIFDELLINIESGYENDDVYHGIKREVPVHIPAIFYEAYGVYGMRLQGAQFRKKDQVSLFFDDQHIGEIDFSHRDVTEGSGMDSVYAQIEGGEWISYTFSTVPERQQVHLTMQIGGEGVVRISVDGRVIEDIPYRKEWTLMQTEIGTLTKGTHTLRMDVISGELMIRDLSLLSQTP